MEVTYLLLTIACNVCNGCNRQPEHDIRKNDNVPVAAVAAVARCPGRTCSGAAARAHKL